MDTTAKLKQLGPTGLPIVSMSGADYNTENQKLFAQRLLLSASLDKLTKKPSQAVSVKRKVAQIRRDLERVDSSIITLNYGLVINYVKKFTASSSRDDSKDFEGAAVVGLMRAVSTYNPKYGSKFSTWAYKPIQRECLKAVREADFKQINPGDFEKRPDILKAAKKVAGTNKSFTIDYQAIATISGASVDAVKRVLHAPTIESMSKPLGTEGDGELSDTIIDTSTSVEDTVLNAQQVVSLENYGLASLDEREFFVICRRFGLDGEPSQRLSAIGGLLKLSREAVRQIESKALSKLNHPVVRRKLVRYGKE